MKILIANLLKLLVVGVYYVFERFQLRGHFNDIHLYSSASSGDNVLESLSQSIARHQQKQSSQRIIPLL